MIMNTFHLQIVTPDGLMFDGDAEKLLVRTTEGDVGIMSGHCDYVTPVDTGMAKVTTNGDVRTAACSGGLLNVKKERSDLLQVRLNGPKILTLNVR